MKFKKILSVFIIATMLFTFLTIDAFAMVVLPEVPNTPIVYKDMYRGREYTYQSECYSVSGCSQLEAYAYSFHTSQTNSSIEISSWANISLQYTDGTFDVNHIQQDSKITNEPGDGVQPCAEATYMPGKIPFQISVVHEYWIDDDNVHNINYDRYYSDYFE